MASGTQESQAVLDRPDEKTAESAANRANLSGDPFQGHNGAIATSERRVYDPTRPHNDWYTVGRLVKGDKRTWGQRLTSPLGALSVVLAVIALLVGMVAINGARASSAPARSASGTSSGSHTMSGMSTSTGSNANVPNATQDFGNQPAKYTLDRDGAKHFTFMAEQVMWEPVKGGQRVLAWTLDGTVPGPVIRVTAGDHVRVTIHNMFPEATTIHFHGLEIPAQQDGVPGVGQEPIKPGQTYTYDFTLRDDNVGTYFYHSHYDDLRQVSGGLYGAFIVDPRPGTPQALQVPAHDREYLQIISELGPYYVINGKSFPDTQVMNVAHGQTVLVRVINMGEMIHPMHLHGHFFNIVAEDGAPLAQPVKKDTLQIAPGESDDFTFYAWAAPGSAYPFHCHILSHVMNPGQAMDEMGGLITLVQYDK